MKKIIAIFAVVILIVSCSTEKQGNMIVQGKIKGLKKGNLYLQKMVDTVLVSVDSIAILGDNSFKLVDNITSPELFYLTFTGSNANERILFFGEEGTITINDHIEKFGINPKISGSKNQEVLDKFNKINQQIINQRLDFIQKDFEAKKAEDKELMAKLDIDFNKLLRKKVLFTTNFALTNSDSEASSYIALTELNNASLQILDTVNNSFTVKVKNSKYGKLFSKYVEDVKKSEAKKEK